MMHRVALLLLLAAPAAGQPARPVKPARPAAEPSNPDALKNRSGLPVPRFGSLRSGRAYMRAGPGKEYPVLWEYVRPGTPLEITYEWNIWRRVRDADGTEGWMDRAMLKTERSLQIIRTTRNLHARADLSSPIVLRAEPGVIARITMCEGSWCRVEAQGRSGYILREQGFGTYPGEPVG